MTWIASPAACANPPSAPRVASERMNTSSSSAWRSMRTRSPSSAPPEKGLLGSTARTPTVFFRLRSSPISASASVLFPAPGEPVMPIMKDRPVWGKSCRSRRRASGRLSSRSRISLEAERMSPAHIFWVVWVMSCFCRAGQFLPRIWVRTHSTIESSEAPGVKIAWMPAS